MTTFEEFMEAIGNANTEQSARQVFLELVEEVAEKCCGEEVYQPHEIVEMYKANSSA